MELHRIAQKKYRQTAKGREAHMNAEKKRRYNRDEENVADATSTPPSSGAKIPSYGFSKIPCCHFCGKKGVVIIEFPRQGYGNRSRSLPFEILE